MAWWGIVLWVLFGLVALYTAILAAQRITYDARQHAYTAGLPHSEDASGLGLDPTGPAQEIMEELVALGFSRLGEARAALPNSHFMTWVLVSSDRTTMADIGVEEQRPDRLAGTLATMFEDQAYVFTAYRLPPGAQPPPLEQDDFRGHTVTESVPAAYTHHLRQVADLKRLHGAPLRLENMQDYLRYERIYLERYIPRRWGALHASLKRYLTIRVVVGAAELVILGFAALSVGRLADGQQAAYIAVPVLCITLLLILLSSSVGASLIMGLQRGMRSR